LIDGLNKHAQTIASLVIAGATMTTKDIIEHLQARIDSAKGAQTTRATWQNAVKSDKDERAKSRGLLSGVKQALLVAFAGQIDTLADFGLNPRKPRVLSPEQKTIAATKARATRAARHTMGKKQKAAVKGTVSPAAPAPAVTPAPAPVPALAPAPAPGPTPGSSHTS